MLNFNVLAIPFIWVENELEMYIIDRLSNNLSYVFPICIHWSRKWPQTEYLHTAIYHHMYNNKTHNTIFKDNMWVYLQEIPNTH